MIIFPAIDIKDGACVRLYKGDFNTVHKVANDPVEAALSFKEAGAQWLHMVDLDGAKEGGQPNRQIFIEIARATGLPVQLGGGIRSMEVVEDYLSSGISRVILGSAALKNPDFVKEVLRAFPQQIAVGIDAKEGFVSLHGWVEKSEVHYLDFARKMQDIGVKNIIFTDIGLDGTLEGPATEALAQLMRTVTVNITASGGIRDIENIRTLTAMGLYGAICGKSLYSGTLALTEAIEVGQRLKGESK